MEQSPIERQPNVDFLDESIEVTFSFSEEAVQWLPQITAEDMQTHRERFVALIGKFTYTNNRAEVRVVATMEQSPEQHETGFYYKEEKEGVNNINLKRIKALIARACQNDSEYKHCMYIGDVHTHPVTAAEYGMDPGTPSIGDLESIQRHFEDGDLDASVPYIFGIASLNSVGDIGYSFYRVVRNKDNQLNFQSINVTE